MPVSDTETVNSLSEHARRVEEKLRLSIAERNELESSTRTQATSDIWHAEHVGRITASVRHAAMTGSKSKTPDRLVAKIMKYQCTDKPLHFDDPRQHGIQLEPVARGAYIEYREDRDAPVSVDECGLFVSIDHPFLATSTDGIVTDASADGNGVLEIKCPVGGRTIAELSVT